MKKIIRYLLVVLVLFTLVACTGYMDRDDYETTNEFETKLVNTAENLKINTVSIVDTRNKPVGGAVLIKEERKGFDYNYFAVTAASVLENKNITIFVDKSYSGISISSKHINSKHNIAIIKFTSKNKLEVAKVFDDGKVRDIKIGQTILSVGTDTRIETINDVKIGTITTTNDSKLSFIHDASTNHGELGTGIYDLDGYLIGINVSKRYYETTNEGIENIFGINKAVSTKLLSNLFKNINQVNDLTLSESWFENLLETKTYSMFSYETKINSLYDSIKNSVVKIKQNEVIYTGLVIEKTGNSYKILTVYIENITDLKVITNNKEYVVSSSIPLDENNFVGILTVETTDTLTVYSNNVFQTNRNDDLVKGQKIVGVGYYNDETPLMINTGSLSKVSYLEDQLFMHDIKLNFGQKGAPIFNLNGKLLGVYVDKINSIETASGEMAGEGLGFAYKLNNLFEDLELTKYESTDDYEKAILKVINDVIDKVITVKTNTGHGSGVMFKKEVNGNKYRYYVLTNFHVIDNRGGDASSFEIRIVFNDDRTPIRATDYQVSAVHDMAVVRFETTENFDVVRSSVIDDKKGLNFKRGQTVIAIGTPESPDKFEYVTTGILKNEVVNYNGVNRLGLNHDAALNPGNSGGPLFDLQGNLIGLNVAKNTGYETPNGFLFAERLGISLNINAISEIYNLSFQLFGYTKVPEHRPRLGITVVEINDFIRQYPQYITMLPEGVTSGIVVVDVDPLYGSYGKLMVYDVIVSVDGQPIKENGDVAPLLADAKFGDEHTVTVYRKGHTDPIIEKITLV